MAGYTIDAAGNLTIDGALTVAGAATITGNHTVSGISFTGTGAGGQPSFHAHRTTNQTSGTTVIFDTVDRQDGGTNYATGTGVFTAPVTGWYYLATSVLLQNTTGAAHDGTLSIQVSGTGVATGGITITANNANSAASCSTVTYMTAGQTASVLVATLSATYLAFGSSTAAQQYTSFSGRLLG